MKQTLTLATLFLLLPEVCYAYLDPGSGNALLYLIVSIGGALLYFCKDLYWKLISVIKKGKKGTKITKEAQPQLEEVEQKKECDLVIFSEGPAYWLTFKPLIEELLKRKIPFRYLTIDFRDPALEIENPLMKSSYIGHSATAWNKISSVHEQVLLATTPNMGTPGFPFRRPAAVKTAIHVSHAVSDISYYRKGSLDHYDVSADVGDWCAERIHRVDEIRKLPKKQCVPVGLLYLDELQKQLDKLKAESVTCEKPSSKGILIAPSWGAKSCLTHYGLGFIEDLLRGGFDITLRPHPQTFRCEKDLVKQIEQLESKYKNFEVDREINALPAMSNADIMISDTSSVRYDYLFLFQRPVITMEIPASDLTGYEADLLGGPWDKELLLPGAVYRYKSKADLKAMVNELLENREQIASQARNLYSKLIYNHGRSAEAVVDLILSTLKK